MTLPTFKENALAVGEVVGDLKRNRKGAVDGQCLKNVQETVTVQ